MIENCYTINDQLWVLLGYKTIKIERGSCGGMVYEWVTVPNDHVLQTADWYAWEYKKPPSFTTDYDGLIKTEIKVGIADPQDFIQRKRKRVWISEWCEIDMEPLWAPSLDRAKVLLNTLKRVPLS